MYPSSYCLGCPKRRSEPSESRFRSEREVVEVAMRPALDQWNQWIRYLIQSQFQHDSTSTWSNKDHHDWFLEMQYYHQFCCQIGFVHPFFITAYTLESNTATDDSYCTYGYLQVDVIFSFKSYSKCCMDMTPACCASKHGAEGSTFGIIRLSLNCRCYILFWYVSNNVARQNSFIYMQLQPLLLLAYL